jgi:putative Holliday junction resolvase
MAGSTAAGGFKYLVLEGMMGRILGVDPGEKNIGLALSDSLGISAAPLCVIRHVSRDEDARTIAARALENDAQMILIGQALGHQGEEGLAARKAKNLAEAVQQHFSGKVMLWDESGSTNAAKALSIEIGMRKSKRRGHLDARTAAYILQDYLDWLDSQKPLSESQDYDR